MLKEPDQRKDFTLSIIRQLDIVAAGTAVLVWLVVSAVAVGQWLLGG